jgi:hypothetical protein
MLRNLLKWLYLACNACLITIHPTASFAMSENVIDFTKPIEVYRLLTDGTERSQGHSSGEFSFHEGLSEQYHTLFAHLEPQPNGAAFVSVRVPIKQTLKPGDKLFLSASGLQSSPTVFQLVLYHGGLSEERYAYQHRFAVDDKQTTYTFDLSDFSAYYRGKAVDNVPALDLSKLTAIGIRIIGREQTPTGANQSGLYAIRLYHLTRCERLELGVKK